MLQVQAAPAAYLGLSTVRSEEQVFAAHVCALAEGDVQRSKAGVRSKRLWHQAALGKRQPFGSQAAATMSPFWETSQPKCTCSTCRAFECPG